MESSNYSQNLISKTTNYFQKKWGVLLSENEAIEILDSLSGLFLAFSDHSTAHPQTQAGCAEEANKDSILAYLNKNKE